MCFSSKYHEPYRNIVKKKFDKPNVIQNCDLNNNNKNDNKKELSKNNDSTSYTVEVN
jgi:hypothetical protein